LPPGATARGFRLAARPKGRHLAARLKQNPVRQTAIYLNHPAMRVLPTLRTQRLVLRPFTLADAPTVKRIAGDAAVAFTTQNIPHPYLDGVAESWIQTHEPTFTRNERLTLAIDFGPRLVGAVGLGFEPAHQRAELGYWIGREYWGQGFATEAARALIHQALEDLALNRVQATHLTRNPASGRVMVKAGMRFEGIHRQHIWKDGVAEDIARYAILRSDLP
jgi:ribosomal-protein-alanine N-acetyltransferase